MKKEEKIDREKIPECEGDHKERAEEENYRFHLTEDDLRQMNAGTLAEGITWHSECLKGLSQLFYYSFQKEDILMVCDKEPLLNIFYEMEDRLDLIDLLGKELCSRVRD